MPQGLPILPVRFVGVDFHVGRSVDGKDAVAFHFPEVGRMRLELWHVEAGHGFEMVSALGDHGEQGLIAGVVGFLENRGGIAGFMTELVTAGFAGEWS